MYELFIAWPANFICGIDMDKGIYLFDDFSNLLRIRLGPIIQIQVVIDDFRHSVFHIYWQIHLFVDGIVQHRHHISICIIADIIAEVSQVIRVFARPMICREVDDVLIATYFLIEGFDELA